MGWEWVWTKFAIGLEGILVNLFRSLMNGYVFWTGLRT